MDRVIEQDDAYTYRVSVLAKKHGITIAEARALKDTGSVIIKTKKATKKEANDGDTDIRE